MRWRTRLWALVVALALLAAACGGTDDDADDTGDDTDAAAPAEDDDADEGDDDADAGEPQHGGEMTVLLGAGFAGAWPSGLDPATNTTGGANISMNQAIFGGLFLLDQEPGSDEAEIIMNQAESYDISDDGLNLTINLREGIQFSDGTDFDAEAVATHIERAVATPCTCAPAWAEDLESVTAADDLTVEIEFAAPQGSAINAWVVSNVNWIPSPTAAESTPEEEFAEEPVGAGPFTVVSNQYSTELVLERNENYHKEDLPYLDRLIFQTVADDQSAYNAIQAGQADAYEGANTVTLLDEADENPDVEVTVQPATSPYIVQLNTEKPPFDDQLVREAFYYATDSEAISEGLFDGRYEISQSFTGPGGLFHEAEVPGYRGYDLERAQEIVEEVGGIQVHLGTLQAPVAEQVNTALQTMWQEAGMEVTIESWELAQLIEAFETGDWDAMLQTVGAWDPAAGVGLAFRFHSSFDFTGVWDEQLDQLIEDGANTVDPEERAEIYQEAGQYISDNAYAPIMFAFAPANLTAPGAHAPGLDTPIPPIVVNSGIHWDRAWVEQ